MEIKHICIVGAGQMGRQIGLNAAIYGYDVKVYDKASAALEAVCAWEDEYLAGRIAKGRMTQVQVDEIKKHFHTAADLKEAAGDADLVIEAVVELYDVKAQLFKELSEVVREDTIIATNSSYMVSSLFKDCVKNPGRLLNCHYYNPALVMKFVEVVQGPHTDPAVAETVVDFCKKTGKSPIWMKKEISGFAANRLVGVLNAEARYLVQNGYLTPQEVDTACELGLGHPMGPFRLMDLTGVDLTYDLMRPAVEGGQPKPDCYDLIESMVKAGKLGRKSKHGFYDYE